MNTKGQRIITLDFKVYPIQKTFGSVLRQSYYWTLSVGKMIWQSLGQAGNGQLGINQLSGRSGGYGHWAGVQRRGAFILYFNGVYHHQHWYF